MDATLVDMGYRGEDASRTSADSRRQLPWQSSSGTGSGGMGSWGDDSPSYRQDDDYARADGYGGFPQSGPQAEYDEYEGYGQHAGYGQDDYGYPQGSGDYPASNGYPQGGGQPDGNGYAQDGGYAVGGEYGQAGHYGHAEDYGHAGGYGQAEDYGHGGDYGQAEDYGQQAGYGGDYRADGYGQSGEYPASPSGYGHSGGYPAQAGGYGQSGGYPAWPAGYGQSGGYPTQDGRPVGRPDLPGRYAGSDWYVGQPGAARGSGFADTGTFTMDARTIDAYGSGGNGSGGYSQNGYQPHGYEQDGYDDGYQDGASQLTVHDPARGFPPGPNGFDAHGYDSGRGYEYSSTGEYPAGYDNYTDEDDPYRYGYGDGMAPEPEITNGKNAKGGKKTGAKRGRRRLLIATLAVVVVGVLGAAAYVFVLKPKPSVGPSTAAAGPLPTAGSASAATAACVKQFGEYCHIQLRTDDPAPLTVAELFPPAFLNETDHSSFSRVGTRLDKTCSAAVIGQDLIKALKAGSCTQVVRASYVSGDTKIMGTIGVVNLATTNEAHYAGKVVGGNDFIAPLSTAKGIASKLGKGTGVVEAQFKGHYLILTWAEFTNATVPKTTAQSQQLEQFENDLVAGTANISLSQRMVKGAPATAASPTAS